MAHLINRRAILGAAGGAFAAGAASSAYANRLKLHGRIRGAPRGGGGGAEFTNPSGVSNYRRAINTNALAAVARRAAGAGDVNIAMVGDSNTVGAMASVPVFTSNPPWQTALKLAALGIPTSNDSLFGFHNLGTIAQVVANIPQLSTTGTGWTVDFALSGIIGGVGFLTSDTTSTFAFATQVSATHCVAQVPTAPGYGKLEWSVDGAVQGVIDLATAGPPGLTKVTLALGSSGTHTISFRCSVTGNRQGIASLDFYDTTIRRVKFWNWGYSNGTFNDLTGTDYITQGAHLAIGNDWINYRDGGTATATVMAKTQEIGNGLQSGNCDFWLVNPVPTSTIADTYNPAGLTLANAQGFTYIDATWEYTFAQWDAAGLSADHYKHQTLAGNQKLADYYVACLRQLFGV